MRQRSLLLLPTLLVLAISQLLLTSCSNGNSAPVQMGGQSDGKTTPAIAWPTPDAIGSSTALSATQLNATANVAGTFTYNPSAGTILAPGSHTLTATFTPTNTAKYDTATATVSIAVNGTAAASPELMYFGGADLYVSGIAISNGSVSSVPGSPYTVLPQGEVGFGMTGAGNLIYISDSNASGSPLTAYSVDAQTGALTEISSGPQTITSVDPTFTYAYGGAATSQQNASIAGYSIDHTSGALTKLSNSPYAMPTELDGGVVSVDGNWYCGGSFNGPGTPEQLTCSARNAATAAIGANEIFDSNYSDSIPIAGSYFVSLAYGSSPGIAVVKPATAGIQSSGFTPICSGCSAISVAVSPATLLVAVGVQNPTGVAIWLYSFDASNGTLTQLSQTTFDEVPVGLLFSCNGAYLAAVHNADNMASVFSISGSKLQELSGSPIELNPSTTGQGVTACP